ncbi:MULTISPECIES: hypothetical protein [unclassified Sulfitobacter]|jgi:hypothetical protein|uniref:hypothetical protein n=1 Tax=unclassified Sulfitobacter TaxID=196795 RepID=UPI000AB0FF18|nr:MULTISPECIES: hypothetical protein [unclassified Sulfitobacter]
MIRALTLLTALVTLTACETHRASKANCFDVVARGVVASNCDFEQMDSNPPTEAPYG